MLKFKRIRYKNLLATGNEFIEIDLCKSPTTLIYGSNGNGKSTLIEAISFGLYNKPFRKINKPQLLNTITNKNLVVEIEFSNYGSEYLVRRGIKPNIFEIYKDNVLLDSNHSSQEYLEETILRVSHRSFCNIYILGSASYIPFMELKPDQRRAIIENLLDLQIFSTMNVLLKDRANQVKQDKQDLSSEVKILEAEFKQIEGLIARNNEFFQKRLNEIQSQVDIETFRYNDLENQINGIVILEENDERPLLNRSRQIDDLISKANYRFQELEKEHEFFQKHHQCPTCRQDIDQTHKEDIISTLLIKKQDICKAVEELQDKLLKTQRELFELQQENIKIREQQNQVRLLKNEQSYVKSKIIDLNKEIDKIQKELLTSAEEFNIINKQVDLNFQKKKLDDLDIRNRIILISQSFLKDTGIKARIISEYIPLINGLINKYLDAMNFMVSFELSETFEETIKSRYRDTFSYNSFSEGEKFRINLAILFAWRDIARLRNSVASNLLLMDEVLDSSLDDDGIDDFFKILKTLDQDTNVFVISHKADQVIDKFDDVIEFKKVKNFSLMEYRND